MRQLSFLPKVGLDHGHGVKAGRRKEGRPLDPKRPIHLVLRSERAKGQWSMLHPKNRKRVNDFVVSTMAKHGVRKLQYANVGNHLHLVIRYRSRIQFQAFLRELTGRLACLITGATKAVPVDGFWQGLAYTKIVHWGRHLLRTLEYAILNQLEAQGMSRLNARDLLSGLRLESSGIGRPVVPT